MQSSLSCPLIGNDMTSYDDGLGLTAELTELIQDTGDTKHT